MTNKRILLGAVLLLFLSAANVIAQVRNKSAYSRWQIFSPPDKSFRIKTPAVMRHVKDPEMQWVDYYAAKTLPSEVEYRYAVAVLRFTRSERPSTIDGLEYMIGGDNRTPTSETQITVDGFPGKEVIYSPPPEYGTTYFRGRIIDAGERIFIIRFMSYDRADLRSASTNLFFNSFHLSRKRLKLMTAWKVDNREIRNSSSL